MQIKKNETPQEQPSEPKTPPASPRRKLVRNVSWSDEIPMREPEENGNDKPKETTTTDPSPVRASFQRKLQVERYTPRFAVPDASKQQACQDDDDDEDGNVGDKDKEGNAGDEKKLEETKTQPASTEPTRRSFQKKIEGNRYTPRFQPPEQKAAEIQDQDADEDEEDSNQEQKKK